MATLSCCSCPVTKKYNYEAQAEEKKESASDIMSSYSKFALACIGNGVRPSDLRMHLIKEVSGMPTTLKEEWYACDGCKLRHSLT